MRRPECVAGGGREVIRNQSIKQSKRDSVTKIFKIYTISSSILAYFYFQSVSHDLGIANLPNDNLPFDHLFISQKTRVFLICGTSNPCAYLWCGNATQKYDWMVNYFLRDHKTYGLKMSLFTPKDFGSGPESFYPQYVGFSMPSIYNSIFYNGRILECFGEIHKTRAMCLRS